MVTEAPATSADAPYAAQLRSLIDEVVAWAQGIDPELALRAPAAGEWSVTETLAHSVEFLRYWAGEATKVAARPGAPFGRTEGDPDRIAWVEEHSRDDVAGAVASLGSAGGYAIERIRAIPPGAWILTGVHPARGSMGIDQIVAEFMVQHLQAHLDQAQQAYAKASGPPGAISSPSP